MKKSAFAALLLASTLASLAHADSSVVFKGVLKDWLTVGENPAKEFKQVGNVLKVARVRLEARPNENVLVVAMPELAGGIRVLDAYATLNVAALPGLALTAGQFKFPFGQNRMPGPQALRNVDYAAINTAVLPGDAWDDGIKATYSLPQLKVEVASVEGMGQNLSAPAGSGFGLRPSQELSGLVEVSVADWTLGASCYQGSRGNAFTEPRLFGGGHLRFKAGPLALQAEFINRDVDRIGYQAEPLLALGSDWAVIGDYERVEDYRSHALGATRLGGGVRWQAHEAVKLTLWAQGDSAGPEQAPRSSVGILQTQVEF